MGYNFRISARDADAVYHPFKKFERYFTQRSEKGCDPGWSVNLSGLHQDHERQRPVWLDDFARVRHQYTGGASPVQVDGNIQV
jgi:hypothetical protein